MTRVIYAFVVILAFAGKLFADEPLMPTSASPAIVRAIALEKDGAVLIQVVTSRAVREERIRVVERDGKKLEEKYSAVVPVFESRVAAAGSDAKVFDRDGKEIDTKKLLTLLKRETPVLLTENGKLDPFYKQVFRDDILVIALPGSTVPDDDNRSIATPIAPRK